MKILYDMELSGNCYKVRLLMALLGEDYRRVPVDLAGGENRRDTFLKLNPRGEIPVLVDGEAVIWDSTAILVYLATNADDPKWYPDDALSRARITQWLAVANHEIHYGLAAARAIKLFGRSGDLKQCQTTGQRALSLINHRLGEGAWLACPEPSIADIACYPYVHIAGDGDIELEPYRNVVDWCRRMESLPGFVPMSNDAKSPLAVADRA